MVKERKLKTMKKRHKYSDLDLRMVKAILKRLKIAVQDSAALTEPFPSPVNFSIEFFTFDDGEEESDYHCGIDFAKTSNDEVIDIGLSEPSEIKSILLLIADFNIKGLDQPLISFKMWPSYSEFEFDGAMIRAEWQKLKDIPEWIFNDNKSTTKSWEKSLAKFITLVTYSVNHNVDYIAR